MFLIAKQPGGRTKLQFMPGWLAWSLLLSLGLTLLLNRLIRIF